MRPHILLILVSTLTAAPLGAATFTRAPLAPEVGLDVLSRAVTRERLGRELFANPYATVTIASVDVYDRFPWVESRRFQVVSDPRWNRLVFGEAGRSLRAFDGAATALGALADPRGLDVDESSHVYVADTGNDRVVVLEASTAHGEIELLPRFAIPGLSRPHDVAYSDGGTPFEPGDDVLYVAETGRNRVVALALGPAGARPVATVGELGSGPGHFAGPMAIAVGRAAGAHTRDVYVADAHNRRIVRLRHDAGELSWVAEAPQDAEVVTSLDTDAWGNLYAAAPHQGVVRKLGADLAPVAELRSGLAEPKGFHVPFFTVRDHRDGRVARVGQPNGVSLERWSDAGGMRLWSLGTDLTGLGVERGATPAASFTLTDRADVTLETRDAVSGRLIGRRGLGALSAGAQRVALEDGELRSAGAPEVLLRVSAASSYPGGATATAETRVPARGGSVGMPTQALLFGASPNPAIDFARIAFFLPDRNDGRVTLAVFDAAGRRVRDLGSGFAPGLNEVTWDGTDARGGRVRAGVYFCRLEIGARRLEQRLVLVR